MSASIEFILKYNHGLKLDLNPEADTDDMKLILGHWFGPLISIIPLKLMARINDQELVEWLYLKSVSANLGPTFRQMSVVVVIEYAKNPMSV